MSKTYKERLAELEDDLACHYKVEPTIISIKPSGYEAKQVGDVRSHNIGASDYATKKIQPWDIWLEYNLNPWDADIIKRVLRTKDGESRQLEYEKIIHICEERIRQLTE